ncbi:adenylate/guanylate cyclase domain-containing protein [uncultured Rhodospira sp.]|uniref:adenylate/guanylate cyclase domain-containing protein n=1 Tax=uncultured Rhodospira sp. TaxID=1936189 RepID=UPI0026261AFE|nr:adenylate/guanylate cyclase domain-containing protein [uncultured Rhodospira sp.]
MRDTSSRAGLIAGIPSGAVSAARAVWRDLSRRHIPLAVNLFTIMAAMTLVVVLALTGFTILEGRRVARDTGQALSRELTAKVAHHVETLFAPAAVLADLSASLPEIARLPDLLVHPMGWYIMQALEANPSLYSAYMGYQNGQFYQIIAVPEQPTTAAEKKRYANAVRVSHGAPPGTRFIHRTILTRPAGGGIQIWLFLDRERALLGSRVEDAPTYDPRARPWYTQARERHGTVMTEIYAFASLGEPGITMARPFDGDVAGVFGVDLTLASIADFLAAQSLSPNGRILVATTGGRIIAYRGPDGLRTGAEYVRGRPLGLSDLGDPAILRALFAARGTADVELVRMQESDQSILVRRIDVSMPGNRDLVIALAAPLTDYTGPVDGLILKSLVYALAVALLGIPVIWLIARRMSRALSALADDAGRIRNLELDHPVRVRTIIKEIHDLAGAQRTMKESLRTFGLFVPKDLVRQIVAAGGSAEPGGQRRELSVLFTDIADFTTLSETTPPEDLMVRTSRYFEEMTVAIAAHQGTVDKFIGDAVMAIWNAPSDCDDHPAKACLGALEARARVAAFNADLVANGYPPFRTRFGLHVGEAVVGNVGSSFRMDYSALGAAINIASRIEGLNKMFGTEILVSDAVAARVSDRFVLRLVDRVQPKGASEAVGVHELLGVHPRAADRCPLPSVDTETVAFAACWNEAQVWLRRDRDWARARDAFADLAAERPDDPLAAHFRDLTARLAADADAAARWVDVRKMEQK